MLLDSQLTQTGYYLLLYCNDQSQKNEVPRVRDPRCIREHTKHSKSGSLLTTKKAESNCKRSNTFSKHILGFTQNLSSLFIIIIFLNQEHSNSLQPCLPTQTALLSALSLPNPYAASKVLSCTSQDSAPSRCFYCYTPPE